MRARFSACSVLLMGSLCGSCAPEETTAHIRARVAAEAGLQTIWVDVVVSWGSSCKQETWFISPQQIESPDLTTIFVRLPATFDILPEHPDGREQVTIFAAARDVVGVLATDFRVVQFEPGERVTTELLFRNPCAPGACEINYEDDVSGPENWCNLSVSEMRAFEARACACTASGVGEF